MRIEDIDTLSGAAFENLCGQLLHKASFQVAQTKLSGDGGVDIYAYNHMPFYCGKYIIQCKRYTGSVGEPIIRDLYGIITSERANKGILITTGTFTSAAKNFASDKNIELIDGNSLKNILAEYNLLNDNNSAEPTFTNNKLFDINKYRKYKDLIDNNLMTEELGQEMLFGFLFKYFTKRNADSSQNDKLFEMINSGLTQEYLYLFDWYVDRHYSTKKKQYIADHYKKEFRDIVCLYNFDIFDYVIRRYHFVKTNLDWYFHYKRTIISPAELHRKNTKINYGLIKKEDVIENLSNPHIVKLSFDYTHYIELMNLLSLFNYFDIKKGITLVNKALYGNMLEF